MLGWALVFLISLLSKVLSPLVCSSFSSYMRVLFLNCYLHKTTTTTTVNNHFGSLLTANANCYHFNSYLFVCPDEKNTPNVLLLNIKDSSF